MLGRVLILEEDVEEGKLAFDAFEEDDEAERERGAIRGLEFPFPRPGNSASKSAKSPDSNSLSSSPSGEASERSLLKKSCLRESCTVGGGDISTVKSSSCASRFDIGRAPFACFRASAFSYGIAG